MKVLIAAGGTAGHINPALAIAGALKKADPTAEIHFAGRKEGMEYRLVTQAGYPFHHIEITGFQRKLSLNNIRRNIITLWNLALSGPTAKKMMKEIQPDLVIGCGGYVSGPVVRCAAKQGIKTALHEQNAFPGVTNKLLAPDVDIVFAAVPAAVEKLGAPEKTIVVGNPVRPEVFAQAKNRDAIRAELGAGDRTIILSFGGSLGARRVNEVVADLCAWEQKNAKPVLHLHATGQYGVELFQNLEKEKGFAPGESLVVKEYINNMPELLAAADLVISRAGALTLAELEAVGRAAVLIPSPNVAENHQYFNAMELQKAGAAVVIEEKDLTGEKLVGTVADLLALVTAEPDSALKAVYRDGTKLEDAAAVKAGDVLRFYADGSTFTADYTVVQKNAWNWVDDFKTDSQGPIWTSQRQVSGKWQTITDFGSDVYPQTYYDKYYGVGVDYQNKSLPADRSAIHGLIADNPGDSAATAMAWTAPKAGSVKVTLDEVTGAHVEPYIRQSNSNGKDVVLKLLKNDEVICSATMTNSFATATGFNECLASAKGTVKVAVGDVLRFSVDAAAGTSKSSIHISPVITYTDADEPSPEPGLSEQYAAAYPASVAAKVGEKATAAVSFTKGAAAADAPAGTTFAVAGDGFTVAADGTVSFTPTDAQAGKTVTATVTVTYSDKSTDTATVTFKVAAKTEPEPKPEPTDPKADLRKEVESASKLDEKDYTADSWKVFAAALDNAKAVLEDKDATEAQISGALTTLKSATAALAKAGDTGKPDDGDKPSAVKPNDKGNGLSKTGASVAVIGVAMLLLAAAGFVTVNVVRRRR